MLHGVDASTQRNDFIPSCFVHCSSDDTLRRMTSRPLQPPATQTPPTVTAQVISAAGTGGSSQGTAWTQSSLSGSQFTSLLSAIQDSGYKANITE